MRELDVIVVGGGIGGLAAGITLRRAGFAVELYERAPAIRPVGYAVCLWPNGAIAIDSLGLADQMAAASPELAAMTLRDADGDVITEMRIDPLTEKTGHRPYPITRAELLDALLTGFGPEHVQLGAECVGVEQDESGATVAFADGRRARASLVVGADGARSTLRRTLAGDVPMRLVAAGWETLVPIVDVAPEDHFTMWIGASRRAATMPVSDERFYTFFDVPPDARHGEGVADVRRHLADQFEGFGPAVQRLIESVDRAAITPQLYHDFDGLSSFVYGRVALLGDSAHATTPYLGQGAAQAIEDAIVLARELERAESVEEALERYDDERRARTEAIVEGARQVAERVIGSDDDAQRWRESLRTSGWDFFERQEQITREAPRL